MHRLVCGETGCGKSRMMRERIIPEWIRRGRPVVVLDPLQQPWRATMQTTDPYEWLETMQRSEGCIGVWDECGFMMEENPALKRDMIWSATVSRNKGHLVYFLSQRFYLVPPSYRLQCTWAYLFRLRGRDLKEAVDLYPEPSLESALPALVPGQCILVKPFEKPVKFRVF
jgi:hypothetical protein